jgi:hypothetical protein
MVKWYGDTNQTGNVVLYICADQTGFPVMCEGMRPIKIL